jgi:hypothetical protein
MEDADADRPASEQMGGLEGEKGVSDDNCLNLLTRPVQRRSKPGLSTPLALWEPGCAPGAPSSWAAFRPWKTSKSDNISHDPFLMRQPAAARTQMARFGAGGGVSHRSCPILESGGMVPAVRRRHHSPMSPVAGKGTGLELGGQRFALFNGLLSVHSLTTDSVPTFFCALARVAITASCRHPTLAVGDCQVSLKAPGLKNDKPGVRPAGMDTARRLPPSRLQHHATKRQSDWRLPAPSPPPTGVRRAPWRRP